jgi:hypothetical protein
MKVQRLYLENIRCFERLEIVFDPPGSSVLVIGENGDGKSTVIRSLAIGLCDLSSASALFRELFGEFVRHGAEEDGGKIEVDLVAGSHTYRIVTTITSLDAFERVDQDLYRWRGPIVGKGERLTQDTFPWDRIFASGYGAGLRVQGTADFEYYLTVDAVYPLFRYDTPLQNPELVVRRLVDQARLRERKTKVAGSPVLDEIKRLLAVILDLEREDQLELTPTGISVRGRWGTALLSSLGDGYRSIVTLVLDMIAWWFLKQQQEKKEGLPTAISGIILIDELEQHLHPRWQRNIVSRLTSSFGDIQFIATTHSPLVASGCENVAVHKLNSGEHTIEEPFGWLAEDVYRFMGLDSSRQGEFSKFIDEFEQLDRLQLQRKLSKSDAERLEILRAKLRGLPGTDPLALTTELMNLAKELKSVKSEAK